MLSQHVITVDQYHTNFFYQLIMPELRPNPAQRDIQHDAALEGANDTPEEVSNQARGHKANLSNPSSCKLLYVP